MTLPWLAPAEQVFDGYIASERLPHALLLAGPSGCGKQVFALSLCKRLLCSQGACGECRSCTLFEGGAHPDFRLLTFEENPASGALRDVITVQQVRTLIHALSTTTTVSERKVALIHPAEFLNKSAANALLKTLEEPTGNAVLILLAHSPGRLPVTIRSRCQRIQVHLPEPGQAQAWLVDQEGIDHDTASLALEAAGGKPLEALALIRSEDLEQYRSCVQMLDSVTQGRASPGQAQSLMVDMDPKQTWGWLSLKAAGTMKMAMTGSDRSLNVRRLADLQSRADRNRQLASTPVRNDLLLREWLLQWQSLFDNSEDFPRVS